MAVGDTTNSPVVAGEGTDYTWIYAASAAAGLLIALITLVKWAKTGKLD